MMESALTHSEESKAFVKELCFEFAEEAAFLWRLRRSAVCEPHYNLSDLLELDNRLEAQIDGLRVAREAGWEECASSFSKGRPEYFFAPSILALESGDEKHIALILEQASVKSGAAKGVISALEWLSYDQAEPHIKKFLASKDPFHQFIGIAANLGHRQDPGAYLQNAFSSPDLQLKTRALKAVGELGGRGDTLMPGRLKDQMSAEDESSRFWAAWSLLLLGDQSALDSLSTFARNPQSPLREEALQLVLRKMDLKNALALHRDVAKENSSQRLAVICAGIIADPALIPWLIHQMAIPALARVAGGRLAGRF